MIRVKMRSSNNIPVSMHIGESKKYPSFSGPYEAIPKVNEQVFQTKNTSMEDDFTVKEITFLRTINESGGYTVTIGDI